MGIGFDENANRGFCVVMFFTFLYFQVHGNPLMDIIDHGGPEKMTP